MIAGPHRAGPVAGKPGSSTVGGGSLTTTKARKNSSKEVLLPATTSAAFEKAGGTVHSKDSLLVSSTHKYREVPVYKNQNFIDNASTKTKASTTKGANMQTNGYANGHAGARVSNNAMSPHAVVKTIKGEIHNVLTALRSDDANGSAATDNDVVIASLQTLHKQLASTTTSNITATAMPASSAYLEPFCACLETRTTSANVTGAALTSLTKFLLYGFLSQHHGDDGLARMAHALLNCAFEETSSQDMNGTNTTASSRKGLGMVGGGNARHHNAQSAAAAAAQEDEKVVLKLVNAAALVVRSAWQPSANNTMQLVLAPHLIVGLLDVCLHVSHCAVRASPLLKSAALDASSQMVLHVFGHDDGATAAALDDSNDDAPLRLQVLTKLAQLLRPITETLTDLTLVASSLTAMNICLETRVGNNSDDGSGFTGAEIVILQNEVCKDLLHWSTSHDLVVLSLTLRVIFNLFYTIRNHLKVPLEVFLTSVHLRILENEHAVEEEREVALESLLEFCQEPALMQDLYLNYDCDVACTNLYEHIVGTLGKVAAPALSLSPKTTAAAAEPPSTVSNAAAVAPPRALQRLALDGLLAVLESIGERCKRSYGRSDSFDEATETKSDDGLRGNSSNHGLSDQELHERRQKKTAVAKVAGIFNVDAGDKSWKQRAVDAGLIAAVDDAAGVAKLLYTAPAFDKVSIGIYLSKGPDKDYPFEASVREHFVRLYDFAEMTFAVALRKYLSKFRLPGEAQCIDRLMESFSTALYAQQGGSSFFKNADAVYVLSFSTIMLNTDLHNPTIKEDRRMTSEQFVRNNRGINGGEDLPADFLQDLYEQIKDKQIQVHRELGEFMKRHEHEDFHSVWDTMVSKRADVATAFFTPAGTKAPMSGSRANLNDREMFAVFSKAAVTCLTTVFVESCDDNMVAKALRGLQETVKIAAFFGQDETVNGIIELLLPLGRDYIMSCATSDSLNFDSNVSVYSGKGTINSNESADEDDLVTEAEHPVPYSMLCINKASAEDRDISGAAAYRGLLALDAGFVLVRKYMDCVSGAWSPYVDCLCALRDAKALPAGLADLDDFADSNGNVLPLSSFARASKRRLEEHLRSPPEHQMGPGNAKKGWLRSFFNKNKQKATYYDEDTTNEDDISVAQNRNELSSNAKMLLGIAETADVENVVHAASSRRDAAEFRVQTLLSALDEYPYNDDPIREQHAVFSLELATRALLSSRDRAADMIPVFLNKFEKVLAKVSEANVGAPFLIERILVTVLRACIHLYDVPEVRPNLRSSLHLLTMSLPRLFVKRVADRMACGLAIILRNSYQYFESSADWAFMGDTLDTLAHHNMSRVFVFDGIASTVEWSLPFVDGIDNSESKSTAVDDEERPGLSRDACDALTKILIRFTLGFYQSDNTLAVPSMLCLDKVYRRRTEVLLNEKLQCIDASQVEMIGAVPDAEAWQNIVVAVYSVCRSPDTEVSRHGRECLQRIILSTATTQVSEERWIAVLYLMVSKQPPCAADMSRGGIFALLGQVLNHVLPGLTHNADNRDDLADLVHQVAALASENLRQGRRGSVSPLFEKTLQTLTYLSNHMASDEWTGETEFSAWASETLLTELEKVGAAGASVHNQAAVQAQRTTANKHGEARNEDITDSSDA